ncbi:MAG: tRNA 2-selenouridine(34) synthase MnmH [Bacteroidales bacterium]
MEQDLNVNDFLIQAKQGVIVDVRTPAEFFQGHIVGAVNIPLFTDQERVIIGTLYKQEGKDIAFEKGLEFVGPKMASFVKEAKKVANGRSIFIYCWRGGMRSGSMAWLFRSAGLEVKRLTGGYKAYRSSFAEDVINRGWKIIVLGGPTGCGKTEILHQLQTQKEQVLDIEGLANHKGSAFGALGQQDQPTTEHFCNILHDKLRNLDPNKPIWCEGESLSIGRIYIPKELFEIMQASPFIYLNLPIEVRLDRLVKEYGNFDVAQLADSFSRIQKRLGGQNAKAAIEYLENGNIREAARIGLIYYDRSYNRSINEHQTVVYRLEAENDSPITTAIILMDIKDKIYDNN